MLPFLAAAGIVLAIGMAQAQPAPVPVPGPNWLPRTTADLVVLDKMRAQPTPLTVNVGQSATFGPLTIALRSCLVRPPDVPGDSAAFLDVTDGRDPNAGFHGWMIAGAPSLSQMEHPLYDVRLSACR